MWLLFIAVAVLVLSAASVLGMGIFALPVVILLVAIGVGFAMRIAGAAAQGSREEGESPHRRTPTGRWDTAEGPEDPDRPRPEYEEKGVAHSGQERMTP